MHKNRFAINASEFGETYHVGASMVICEEVEAFLVGSEQNRVLKQQKHFLSVVGKRGVKVLSDEEYDKRKRKREFDHLRNTTKIIAAGFQSHSQKIKAAFLKGVKPEDKEKVKCYLGRKGLLSGDHKVLIWIRQRKCYEEHRNITLHAVSQLKELAKKMERFPVCVGHNIDGLQKEESDLVEFWRDCPFDNEKGIFLQLYMYQLLNEKPKSLVSVGMMSGAMDGPAFIGVPTIWFAKECIAKMRMKQLVDIVPKFQWLPIQYTGRFERLSCCELAELRQRLSSLETGT